MNPFAVILLLLALPIGARTQPLPMGRPPLHHGELTSHPWSEDTDLVRIPKGLLPHLYFDALVYSATPDGAKSLGDEWLLRLKGIVGRKRGELLDLCLRDTEAQSRRSLLDLRPVPPRSTIGWPVWLVRGRSPYEFTVTIPDNPEAQYSLEVEEQGNPEGFRASSGGPVRSFPGELKHLFRGTKPPAKSNLTL